MSNFTRVRAPGGWTPASVVYTTEFEAFDAIRLKLPNMSEGSAHSLTGDLVIGSSGGKVWLAGDSRLDGIVQATLKASGFFEVPNTAELRIGSGGLLVVQTGGNLNVGTGAGVATLTVLSGSLMSLAPGSSLDLRGAKTVKSGAVVTWESGSTLVHNSGATWNLSGDVFFAANTWPKLSPARSWERHSLTIAATTEAGVTPVAQARKVISNLAGGVDAIRTEPTDSPAQSTIVELEGMPDGSTLTNIQVVTQGISATGGLVVPNYQVVRWKGAGAAEFMSSLTPDDHSIANYTTNLITTTVPVNAFATIDKSYRYGLRIFHAYAVSAPTGAMFVYDVVANGTAARIGL